MRKVRDWFLSVLVVFSCLISVWTSSPVLAETTTDFYKSVLIDCGRGYYTVDQIKTIIDYMEMYDYDQLMLGFGNDGLRFVLDDMSVTANGTTYDSDTIKNAISEQNRILPQNSFSPNTSASAGAGVVVGKQSEWTQAEMDAIVAYAATKSIQIIPMIDVPGHATSICAAIEAVGITNGYLNSTSDSTDLGSATINIENSEAYNFTLALLQKYINYFHTKGCKDFNFAMDEFMGNNGGYNAMSSTQRTKLAQFVTDLHAKAVAADMNMIAFCDVIGNLSGIPTDNTLIGINWNGGYLSGHRNINANMNWYYVLGSPFGTYTSSWSSYAKSKYHLQNTTVNSVVGGTAGAGCLLAIWNDSYYAAEDSYIDEILDLMDTQSANNPDYFKRKQYKTITLEQGETYTEALDELVEDQIYLDNEIATVEVATETVLTKKLSSAVTSLNSGSKYVIEQSRAGTVLTDNDSGGTMTLDGTVSVDSCTWTITAADGGWYVQNSDGKYLTVGAGTAGLSDTQVVLSVEYIESAGGWQIGTGGQYLNQFGGTSSTIAGGWRDGAASDSGSKWNLYEVTESSTSKVLKITGKTVGTTVIEIGGTVYTINVVEENLTNVSLTCYPFISDYPVYETGTSSDSMSSEGYGNPQQIGASEAGVNTEEGTLLENVVWAAGDWKWEGDSVETTFWKGVLHQADNTKQVGSTFDQSLSGIDFKYIRYYDRKWSVSNDQVTWIDIAENDEVCAYYLQKTEITQEVTTYVKDWAYTTADYNQYKDHSGHAGYKALTFAVVYPDGTVHPTEDEMYVDSTLIYWENTGVTSSTDTMMLYFQENGDYDIDRITYTFGTVECTAVSQGSLDWQKADDWYDETVCWRSGDEQYGSEPVVQTSAFLEYGNNEFDAPNDAMLILVYIKPKITVDTLHVHYIDQRVDYEFYNYDIAVNNDVVFDENISLNETSWKGPLNNGTVQTNIEGVTNTVSADLSTMPDIAALYRNKNYTCVEVVRSEDGKDVYLCYNFEDYAINYIPVIDGVVSPDSTECYTNPSYELVASDEEVQGSSPAIASGSEDLYEFIGWYVDEACKEPVNTDWINENNEFKPDVYESSTFYALFQSKSNYKVVVEKQVTGNMGSRTKEFEFQIGFGNQSANRVFSCVDVSGTEGTITADENGFTSFNLSHGQKIEITGLTVNDVRYLISNNLITKESIEGSVITNNITETDSEGYEKTATVGYSEETKTITVTYVNSKNSSVPTGKHNDTFFTYAGGAAILGFALIACKKMISKLVQKGK